MHKGHAWKMPLRFCWRCFAREGLEVLGLRSSGFGFIRFGGFRTEGLVVDLYTGTTALREVGSDKRVLALQLSSCTQEIRSPASKPTRPRQCRRNWGFAPILHQNPQLLPLACGSFMKKRDLPRSLKSKILHGPPHPK